MVLTAANASRSALKEPPGFTQWSGSSNWVTLSSPWACRLRSQPVSLGQAEGRARKSRTWNAGAVGMNEIPASDCSWVLFPCAWLCRSCVPACCFTSLEITQALAVSRGLLSAKENKEERNPAEGRRVPPGLLQWFASQSGPHPALALLATSAPVPKSPPWGPKSMHNHHILDPSAPQRFPELTTCSEVHSSCGVEGRDPSRDHLLSCPKSASPSLSS